MELWIDLQPKKCNLCGGEVEFISNARIYGRPYGSGKCYRCKSCGAFVGTHEQRPRVAFGILADKDMREMKKKCHALFDPMWKRGGMKRYKCYKWLAERLGIPVKECHFGYFGMDMLNRAYEILKENRQ